MQWAYRIRRKISAALLLAAIFVLVFVKNTVEEKYVTELGDSFATVYEDRLVVESYIFRLSNHLFRKKILIDTCRGREAALSAMPLVADHHEAIATLIADYEKTKLTTAESGFFADFRENIRDIRQAEEAVFRRLAEGQGGEKEKVLMNEHFTEASKNLASLSGIQIAEGKLLNDHAKKIVAGSSLLTQFELGILIAIGLMIVVLVFESTSAFSKPARKESMN